MATIDLGYQPRDWQAFCHNHKRRFTILALHRRAGKALDVDTPIPVYPSGFKRMGDLKEGDVVFDENGQPCNVVYAHNVMHDRRCLEVTFSDGASIICDEDHLWHTQTKLDRAYRRGRNCLGRGSGVKEPRRGKARMAKEIEDTLKYVGEYNHTIPLAGAVAWEEQELPIPAYIFGCWLGDGHSNTSAITTMDEEIRNAFQVYADESGYNMRPHKHQNSGKATTYQISRKNRGNPRSMMNDLRKLGTLGNKHIPSVYAHASVAQRTDLLAGILDTDGSVSKCGAKGEVTFANHQLAVGTLALMQTLGYKPTLHVKRVGDTDYFRINFTPRPDSFNLTRKRERVLAAGLHQHGYRKYSQQRAIVKVAEVPSRPVRCITVDSANHLYLCGEQCVPTHNTEYSIAELVNSAINFDKDLGFFVYVAPYLKQAKLIAWNRLKDWLRPIEIAGGCEYNESELTITFKHNRAAIRVLGADNPDALRGVRLDGAVIDEVAQIKPEVWVDIIQPALSDRKGWALFIGTPNGVNLFSELYFKAERLPDWFAKTWDVFSTTALDPEEVARLRRDMSETSFAREYMCDFNASGVDQLISLADIQEACNRHIPLVNYQRSPRILGVDPARFGDDRSVVFARQGLVAFPPDVYRGLDNMELAAQVAVKIDTWHPDAVFIDSGAGAGVIDRLRHLGYNVIEVPFGGRPNDARYYNKRSEMWHLLADWVRSGGAIPDMDELKQDLGAPTFTYDRAKSKLVLESKEDIKARIQCSPDLGDALALTFAHPVGANASMRPVVDLAWGEEYGTHDVLSDDYNPYQNL